MAKAPSKKPFGGKETAAEERKEAKAMKSGKRPGKAPFGKKC